MRFDGFYGRSIRTWKAVIVLCLCTFAHGCGPSDTTVPTAPEYIEPSRDERIKNAEQQNQPVVPGVKVGSRPTFSSVIPS